jgi:DNA-binding transcriptional LysR family regulator
MRPHKLDLNLLAVFDAIFAEGNLTRAAARMCMSQPAMSNALNRLRRVAKDDLFVRDGRGIHPTPVAVELAPIVRQALNLLETGLETTPGLRAGRFQSFSIAGMDYYEVVILPKLIARVAHPVPRSRLQQDFPPNWRSRFVSGTSTCWSITCRWPARSSGARCCSRKRGSC